MSTMTSYFTKRKKRVLVVTPIFPFPATGAEQADRACGFAQLTRLGFDVRVIVKLAERQSREQLVEVGRRLGVKFTPVPYCYSHRILSWRERIRKLLLKFKNPLLFDGAALEYSDPTTKQAVAAALEQFNPDVVWFDYTYLWPLYKIVKTYNRPIVVRSINFEPIHFLQEEGWSVLNCLKVLPKLVSELITIRAADLLFAITPKEEKIYRTLGAKNVQTLPLRSLSDYLRGEHPIIDRRPLQVLFMGSTYNVAHNRRALEFIIKDIAPHMHCAYPGEFIFYILGSKMPAKYLQCCRNNVIYKGRIDDREFEDFLADVDIALMPSFFGAGMQQKIFEPLARGIPTLTAERGVAGYNFQDNIHLVLARNFNEFIAGLLRLRDRALRERLSINSIRTARRFFSRAVLDEIVNSNIHFYVK